jgi:general stress protein YciG
MIPGQSPALGHRRYALVTHSALGYHCQMTRKNPHAVALGRKGGQAGKGHTSKAKADAARINGRKGGRPRKK